MDQNLVDCDPTKCALPGQVWQLMPVIPALGGLMQEDFKFKVSLSCIVRRCLKKQTKQTGHWWLMPVILATWEAEIERIQEQGQPRQIVPKTNLQNIIAK
jgi:hypothetical protein